MRRAVTLQRAVEAKGLPLAIRGVGDPVTVTSDLDLLVAFTTRSIKPRE
jgi:hypothetical protein